jgi:hypothetical protein
VIEIRFRDIDPDTGKVSQDKRIALCDNENMAKWVLYALDLAQREDSDPNREIYSGSIEQAL